MQSNTTPLASESQSPSYLRWLSRHTLVLFAVLLLVVITIVLWSVSRSSDRFLERTTLHDANLYLESLAEFRTFYTNEVVATAKAHGMKVSHDYKHIEGAIPLPATLSMLLSKQMSERGSGGSMRLFSDYPFPSNENGGPLDAFERKALASLRENPGKPYYSFEHADGKPVLRYASAELMRSSCINCHNTHTDAPKNDWKVGDLRGVLAVTFSLEQATVAAAEHASTTIAGIVSLALVGVLGAVLMVHHSRKASRTMEYSNRRLEDANHRLAHRKNELTSLLASVERQRTQVTEAKVAADERSKQVEMARRAALNMMRDMEEAKSKADAATVAKSEFLANMSHEIRTPMTAILGFADMLRDDCKERDQLDAIDTIKRNGDHLLSIINDILDLSKVEAGKMELETMECSPSNIVDDVVSLMQVRADEKKLELFAKYEGPIPEYIKTDPHRLRQILINFVGNAIKFTETGTVSVTVKLLAGSSKEPRMQFDVTDTGMGMTEKQKSQLFQPFVQADTSTSRQFGGTGLGLTISKRMAEMLGGDIAVVSTEGEGSTFTVTLGTGSLAEVRMIDPANDGSWAKVKTPSSESAGKTELDCRVLLAEDGPDNQRLISSVLKKAGAEVVVAENGQIAIDHAVAACEEGNAFDVILMDMQMPVLGGYDATRQLRDVGYTGSIVALTAHAMAGDRQKCIEAGCDEYATKPIDRQGLIALVHNYATAGIAKSQTDGSEEVVDDQ